MSERAALAAAPADRPAGENELQPCPFCGGAAELDDQRLCWFVRCSDCGACVMGERAPEPEDDLPEGYWESFRQSAVEKWNRRTALLAIPVAGEVEGLVKELQMMASHAAATCQFTDAENLSRTAELLQQQHPAPVPVSEEPWKRKGWCDERGRCWLQGKVEGDWRLLDPVNGVPQLKYCFNRSLPAHALPLPQGEVK